MRNAENVKMEKAEAGFEVVNGRRGMAAGNDEEMEIDLLAICCWIRSSTSFCAC